MRTIGTILAASGMALALGCGPMAVQKPAPPPNSSAPADVLPKVRAATTAFASGEYRASASLYDQVVRANPVNPTYWRALAASRYLAGDYRASIPPYLRALRLGQDQPGTLAFFIARAYAESGDDASGMAWLKKALAWGYPDLDRARTDAAILLLKTQPGFDDLLGIVDASHMTRIVGWRYDLAFLARLAKATAYHPFKTSTGDQFVSNATLTEAEFDDQVRRLDARIPTLSDPQVELAMMRLMADLGDGHTELGGGPRPEYAQTLPLKFEQFQDGLFVTAAVPAYRSLLGAQVLAMDGRTIAAVTQRVAPYISRDNDYWLAAVLPYRLRAVPFLNAAGLADRPDRVTLRVRQMNGRIVSDTVLTTADFPDIWNTLPSPKSWINLFDVLPAKIPLYLTRTGENYWYTYDGARGLLYLQYNRIEDSPSQTLASFADELSAFLSSHDVRTLVIDMRWNNGGDTTLNTPMLGILERSAAVRDGSVFVITGPRTFSAGLNAADYFQRDLKAVVVGEPTGGKPNAPGDETFFTLPYSKISVNFSTVYWESGWPEDARTSLAPDVYTPRTFAAYLKGDDPAMDAILASARPASIRG